MSKFDFFRKKPMSHFLKKLNLEVYLSDDAINVILVILMFNQS